MRSKRDRRRAIIADEADEPTSPPQIRLINFGTPRRPADRCTYLDAPAQFGTCFDCRYNKGAQGSGILCAHRFGIDPTVVAGMTTQFKSGDIIPLDD